jgi:hypothetical protein
MRNQGFGLFVVPSWAMTFAAGVSQPRVVAIASRPKDWFSNGGNQVSSFATFPV